MVVELGDHAGGVGVDAVAVQQGVEVGGGPADARAEVGVGPADGGQGA